MLKASQNRNEASGFVAGINVQTAGENFGLAGDHAHRVSTEVAKADDDVLRPFSLNFHETAVVQHLGDDIEDIVGFGRVVGDDAV